MGPWRTKDVLVLVAVVLVAVAFCVTQSWFRSLTDWQAWMSAGIGVFFIAQLPWRSK